MSKEKRPSHDIDLNRDPVCSFLSYLLDHPNERFWQALRNWSHAQAIFWDGGEGPIDTFYWENDAPDGNFKIN